MRRLQFPLMASCIALVLLADSPSPGRKYTTVARMEEAHLEAVHQARVKFAQDRKILPRPGVYTDYRAVIHVHAEDADSIQGTRAEVLEGAKSAGVQVVMFTDHRRAKKDARADVREALPFIPGAPYDHLLPL